MHTCGLILLAAGASTRLQQPKQLLPYRGSSLLRHCINVAAGSMAQPLIVVLGANEEQVKKETDGSKAYIVNNEEWHTGMSSSVRAGLAALLKLSPFAERVLFMVCDQPHISSGLLNGLVKTSIDKNKDIVACSYGDAAGVPVLFSKKYFPDLFGLEGPHGAKQVLKKYANSVATIPFPMGEIDIDTMQDYKSLLKQ